MILSFPYAGIIRIRFKGMISARNYKAPHSLIRQRYDLLQIYNQNLVYFYGLIVPPLLNMAFINVCTGNTCGFQFIIKLAINSGDNMKTILAKLNYKGQGRIAVINAEDGFLRSLSQELKDVTVDREIDPRFPYDFILIFARSVSEVESITPAVLHNLLADGVLWFCYQKKTSKSHSSDIDRDHGWKALTDSGFHCVRMVALDDDWSAMRFRNSRFIKSVPK
jgi:hypothetical protein